MRHVLSFLILMQQRDCFTKFSDYFWFLVAVQICFSCFGTLSYRWSFQFSLISRSVRFQTRMYLHNEFTDLTSTTKLYIYINKIEKQNITQILKYPSLFRICIKDKTGIFTQHIVK